MKNNYIYNNNKEAQQLKSNASIRNVQQDGPTAKSPDRTASGWSAQQLLLLPLVPQAPPSYTVASGRMQKSPGSDVWFDGWHFTPAQLLAEAAATTREPVGWVKLARHPAYPHSEIVASR